MHSRRFKCPNKGLKMLAVGRNSSNGSKFDKVVGNQSKRWAGRCRCHNRSKIELKSDKSEEFPCPKLKLLNGCLVRPIFQKKRAVFKEWVAICL
jgi:hypothetical protein